jgi:hypothetical protein
MHVTTHLQPLPASTALTYNFRRSGAGIGSSFRTCDMWSLPTLSGALTHQANWSVHGPGCRIRLSWVNTG